MSTLGTFLTAASLPVVKRVLAGLGIGTITYVGLQAAFTQASGFVSSYYGQIGGDAAGLIGLLGMGEALGIILGALSARMSMMMLSKLGKVI